MRTNPGGLTGVVCASPGAGSVTAMMAMTAPTVGHVGTILRLRIRAWLLASPKYMDCIWAVSGVSRSADLQTPLNCIEWPCTRSHQTDKAVECCRTLNCAAKALCHASRESSSL